MVVYRRGAKCNNCCAEPECSLSVTSILFNGVDYTWTIAVYYKNASSATLTGYGGGAFTFPSFNGTVTFTADKCEYNRLVLHVVSPSGAFEDCVWNNPNCCCIDNVDAPCNKYRVALSGGSNADQTGLIVNLSGAAMTPSWASTCPDLTAFFTGAFYVPFQTTYSASSDFTCTYLGFPVTVRCTLDIFWGYQYGCDTEVSGDEGPSKCLPSDSFGIARRHFVAAIRGRCTAPSVLASTSSFGLSSLSNAYQVADYKYVSCNPYAPCSNPVQCVYRPKAPLPTNVQCSSQISPGSCCGFPCTSCAAQCGGAVDFRAIQATFAEA